MIPVVIPDSSMGRWPRGLQYRISIATNSGYPELHEERIVPLSGTRVKWYEPTEEHEIPDRLIEVATGLTDPVEFADEYGLLGYAQLHSWGLPHLEMGDYPLNLIRTEDPNFLRQLDKPRAPAHIELTVGEPLHWFKAHAITVKLAHDLIISLKQMDERRMRDLLEGMPRKQFAALDAIYGAEAFDWVPDHAPRDLLGTVHEAIIGLINPNIRGLQRELHLDRFSQLRYSLTFTALIQVIYWHLAARLDSDKLLPRNCERCGEPFFAGDRRQRYCPKPLGKSRSVCGARAVKETFKRRWPSGRSKNSSTVKARRRHHTRKKKKYR